MVDLEAFGDYWHYKLVGNFRHSKPFGLLICKIEGLMAEAHMSIIHREEFLTSLVKSTIFVQRSRVYKWKAYIIEVHFCRIKLTVQIDRRRQ